MHIHLPKPSHGWREFLGEVGVIVIGVLIALGAEQAVEAAHHRSQVHEMTAKLRAESLENRHVLGYDLLVMRQTSAEIDADIGALGNCTGSMAELRPLAPVNFLLPSNTAWLAVRDIGLLPLMPEGLADSYWKLDAVQESIDIHLHAYDAASAQAAGAVESVRRGGADRQLCNETSLSLERLKQTAGGVSGLTDFYRTSNERVLRGERLDLAGDVLRRQSQMARAGELRS
jgi:hypothetical protein